MCRSASNDLLNQGVVKPNTNISTINITWAKRSIIVLLLVMTCCLMGCSSGMPTDQIDGFIKKNPNCKMSDGYCTVAWGGDNPNGGTYFLLTNNTNDYREVDFEFILKNNSSASEEPNHSERYKPSYLLEPHEQKYVHVSWREWVTKNGQRPLISVNAHKTELESVTSTISDKE